MAMGKGEQWEADNWTKLNGDAVKNKRLVDSITGRLRTLNVESRKVKGHNGNQ
jgi:ribonuclease HI